jgi:hypothetical protein
VNETTTLLGGLVDELGHARQIDPITGRQSHWATPGSGLRSTQPTTIPVNIAHRPELTIGELHWLERWGQTVYGVAVVDGEVRTDTPIYFSAETDSNQSGNDTVITAVALVERTAQLNIAPIRALPGGLDYVRSKWRLERWEQQIVTNAIEHYKHRRRAAHSLFIRDGAEERASAKAAAEFERSLPRFRNLFEQRPVLPPGVFVRPAQILRITR